MKIFAIITIGYWFVVWAVLIIKGVSGEREDYRR